MIGSHCIRTWSSTQASVTLSSGEAEYYGLVKAAGAGLGHQSLMDDLGVHLSVRVWTDSSAALGVSVGFRQAAPFRDPHALGTGEGAYGSDIAQEGLGRGEPRRPFHQAPPQ